MSEEKELVGCLTKNCRECDWHVVKQIRLDCNRGNRLGLAKPVLGNFASGETGKQVLKEKLEAKKKEMEDLEKALEESGEEVS